MPSRIKPIPALLCSLLLFSFNSVLFGQPWHTQVLYHDNLDNPNSKALGTMKNNGGAFIAGRGWQAVTSSSQLFITLPDNLPWEGSLEVSVTNFDPAEQATDPEIKYHCINIWSRPEADKDAYETTASWTQIRTSGHDKYNDGDGRAGFKWLTQTHGSGDDSREEDYYLLNKDWDTGKTYTFRIVWTETMAYLYLNNVLLGDYYRNRTYHPFSGRLEPFRFIFLGKENLIWGYETQIGPIYSNLTIYGADGSTPPPPPPPPDTTVIPPPSGKGFTDITASSITGGYSSAGYGQGSSFGDADKDGWMDLFVSNGTTYGPMPDLLYMNERNETFSEEASARGTASPGLTKAILLADFDRDADLDAFFGNIPLSTNDPAGINALYFNDSTGHFTERGAAVGLAQTVKTTNGCVAFDMERDGDLDLFIVNSGELNELYQNDGSGHFTLVQRGVDGSVENTAIFGRQGATAGDIDNDGDIDLYVCRRQESSQAVPNWLFVNDGDGHFSEEAAARGAAIDGRSHGATFADIDYDGDLDLFVVNYSPATGGVPLLNVLLNEGTGHFSDRTSTFNLPISGYTVAFGDLDNDADLDLLLLRNGEKDAGAKPQLYWNDGDGNFTLADNSGVEVSAADARSAALADIDNDGDLDIYIACAKGGNFMLRNDLDNGLHSIDILCTGPEGELGGIGTRVSLYAAGHLGERNYLIGYQEVGSQFGYMSQNPVQLHFGLGSRTTCDVRAVLVTGDTIEVENAAAGQLLRLAAVEPPRIPVISKVQGGGGEPIPGQEFVEGFAVRLVDQNSLPFVDHPVQFEVMQGSGHLRGVTSLQVMTDDAGIAEVYWTPGPYKGVANLLKASAWIEGVEVAGSPVTWSYPAADLSETLSEVNATSPIHAGGVEKSAIEVFLRNSAGQPLGAGYTVEVRVSGSPYLLAIADTLTDAMGRVSATLSAAEPGACVIHARVKGLDRLLADSATVSIVPVPVPNEPPQIFTYFPTENPVYGQFYNPITFALTTVRDADGDSLQYLWRVNGLAASTDSQMVLLPTIEWGKEYTVVAMVMDAEDTARVEWRVLVALTRIGEEAAALPEHLRLQQNYPNPFNPSTRITVEVPHTMELSICIYNTRGQRVRQLHEGLVAAGVREWNWDARNDAGQPLPSGVYHAVLRSGGEVQIRRLVFMK
jgi:hypothetical protein